MDDPKPNSEAVAEFLADLLTTPGDGKLTEEEIKAGEEAETNMNITRCVVSIAWLAFYAGLIYFAQSSVSAVAVCVFISAAGLIGACQLYEKKKTINRFFLPAWFAFPCDVLMALASVHIGGWMALAGAMMIVASTMELVIFGDIKCEGFGPKT